LVFFLVLTGILSELLTAMFGFLYPAYMSCKALEHEKTAEKSRTQWLTYWVVFSALLFIDLSFGWLISFIPFYHVIKLLLLLWLFYPKSNGAEIVYSKFLRPWLKLHEKEIDDDLAAAEKLEQEAAARLKAN